MPPGIILMKLEMKGMARTWPNLESLVAIYDISLFIYLKYTGGESQPASTSQPLASPSNK